MLEVVWYGYDVENWILSLDLLYLLLFRGIIMGITENKKKYHKLISPTELKWERISINNIGIDYKLPFTPILLEKCKRYKCHKEEK